MKKIFLLIFSTLLIAIPWAGNSFADEYFEQRYCSNCAYLLSLQIKEYQKIVSLARQLGYDNLVESVGKLIFASEKGIDICTHASQNGSPQETSKCRTFMDNLTPLEYQLYEITQTL